ncbi:MAG: hypothetical protein AAGC92_07120 [Pseudomonadota bacterium]
MDQRYASRAGSLASDADSGWCGAIGSGLPFKKIGRDNASDDISAAMGERGALIRIYADDNTTLELAFAAGALAAAMNKNRSAALLRSK